MTKRSLLFTLVFLGCAAPASRGEQRSSVDPLSLDDPDKGASAPDAGAAPTDAGAESVDIADIEYIEVDESAGAVPRKIRVDADCRVTDHTGLDAMAGAQPCQDLFAAAIDATNYGCGFSCVPDNACAGTVRVHLIDGRDLVRDLQADRCSVAIPGIPTHKATYAAWFSAGGGDGAEPRR